MLTCKNTINGVLKLKVFKEAIDETIIMYSQYIHIYTYIVNYETIH